MFLGRTLAPEAEVELRKVYEVSGYRGVLRRALEFRIAQTQRRCTDELRSATRDLAYLNEGDRMFECLDEALPLPSAILSDILTLIGSQTYDPYRDDPRFVAAVNRLVPEF